MSLSLLHRKPLHVITAHRHSGGYIQPPFKLPEVNCNTAKCVVRDAAVTTLRLF